jgi:pimeloyl-ACP methyl ester carboxylesterase
VLDGRDLGANLALEVAAAHPELAGVVLESPLEKPMNAIFNDPRAHMVPAHLLVGDRFDSVGAAAQLKIPSLWIYQAKSPPHRLNPEPFQVVTAHKMLVWQYEAGDERKSLARWLDDLAPASTPPVH